MKVGISTACLYPMYLEDAIDFLLGIPYIEIFINTHSELKEKYVKDIRKKLDEHNTKCVSLHPYTCVSETLMLFSVYERRIADCLDYYKYYFNAMNILGSDIFVLHGCKDIASVPNELYFERFLKLYECGKSFGITVAQENVVHYQSGSLDFLISMRNTLKEKANFVLDTKQCIRCGIDVYETAEALKDNIVHVHLSDHGKKGDCLPVGKGVLDIKKLRLILKDTAFILELYKNNYDKPEELIDNYNYIKNNFDV
ncbi:MAG: sugar phosphate isomerase/epimerase [Oscillospiraceae bacterium]|jgi:sugar phosphate isomerase/epimerase|nr:sugar phosphate isomerase/epimerase [Oscillospiraceae bacterium]